MPRFLRLACIAGLSLAAGAAESANVDEILSLRGGALFEAAQKADMSEFSTRDLVRIAQTLSIERKNIGRDDLNRFAFDSYFEHACERANASELAQVIQLYVSLEPESFEKSWVLPPLAARWIHEEIKGIAAQPPLIDLGEIHLDAAK